MRLDFANIRLKPIIFEGPEVAELWRFLQHRWTRFIHPVGRPRIWNPGKWRWNERVLVPGESVACISATLALIAELLQWHGTNWSLLATPHRGVRVAPLVRLGYRFRRRPPLATVSIKNIRQVVQGMMMEDAGAVVDWQNPDDQGSIPLRIE